MRVYTSAFLAMEENYACFRCGQVLYLLSPEIVSVPPPFTGLITNIPERALVHGNVLGSRVGPWAVDGA